MNADDRPAYLLDLVPGACAAFGLRVLNAALGPAGSIGRFWDWGGPRGGSRSRVGVSGSLNLSAASELSRATALRCCLWFDQSGHAHHAKAVGAEPVLGLLAGDHRPFLHFEPPATLCSEVTLNGLGAFAIFGLFRAQAVAEATSVARWQNAGDFVVFPYHTGEVLVGAHNGPIDGLPLGIAAGRFDVHGIVWQQGAADGFATYLNGEPIARRGARMAPVTVGGEPLFIGSYAGMGEHFSGDLVELVIWPRALSDDEIRIVCRNMRDGWLQTAALGNAAVATIVTADFDERLRRILDLDEAGLATLGMDRLTDEIQGILDDPAFDALPLDRLMRVVARISEIYTGHWHASGHALIPALERLFRRVVAMPEAGLDALCRFYDLLYFLYWYVAADFEAMRGIAAQVMRPFAAAIRAGAMRDLPIIEPRTPGRAPLRLGYLLQFARLGNPIASIANGLLGGLARHRPDDYRLVLYAWSEVDDAFLAPMTDLRVIVRRFDAGSTATRVAAVAAAVADDKIDILITDMNSALPTVLFERRVAPVQIFLQAGLPFWPIANIDAVFCADSADFISQLAEFDAEKCFTTGLGPWNLAALAPAVDAALLAAERARYAPGARLVGTYGRLAKITPDFLEIVAELLDRHPRLVVLLGGTGDGGWIRRFIEARRLVGRIELVERYVDGHLWGYLLEVFLDTFPQGGGASAREVMAKGRPVAGTSGDGPEADEEVPMLTAHDRAEYVSIVSRLLDDKGFYEEACAATRAYVASRPTEADCAAFVDTAISTTVERVRPKPERAANPGRDSASAAAAPPAPDR